jgi:hypothetical protein
MPTTIAVGHNHLWNSLSVWNHKQFRKSVYLIPFLLLKIIRTQKALPIYSLWIIKKYLRHAFFCKLTIPTYLLFGTTGMVSYIIIFSNLGRRGKLRKHLTSMLSKMKKNLILKE